MHLHKGLVQGSVLKREKMSLLFVYLFCFLDYQIHDVYIRYS